MRLAEPAFQGFPFATDADDSPIPTEGLAIWLDACSGVGLDGGTLRVSSWTGRGGRTSALQATTAAMPTLAMGVQNGLPGVRFDGADDALALVAAPTFTDGITLLVVANFADYADHHYVLTSTAAGALGYAALSGSGYPLLFRKEQGVVGDTAPVAPTAGIAAQLTATWDRNGGSAGPYALRMDGATNRTGTYDSAAIDVATDRIGSGLGSGAMSGLIHELIAYRRTLRTSEILAAEAYLRRKWGTA